MLFPIDSDEPIRGIPRRRQEQWNVWCDNIPDSDLETIVRQVNDYCDTHRVFISSFIPGDIWGNETCQPLLDACNQNEEDAGFFFGLIVWQTLIERDDKWLFLLADKEGDEVLGTKYWRREGQG